MTLRRALFFAATIGVVAAWPAPALAAPVELTAAPLLGERSPAPQGWYGYSVRVRGTGAGLARGTVEITDGQGGAPRAEFAVRPQDQVVVELYAHDVFSKSLEAIARDESGDVIAKVNVENTISETPLLFDAGGTGRLGVALRDEKIATRVAPHAWAPPEGLTLTVTAAVKDPRSGEPILPRRAMGYGGATVVLVRSDVLVGLPEAEATALSDWVLTGGAVAIAVARPEDLAHPRVAAWIGAGVRREPSAGAADFPTFDVVMESSPTQTEPTYGTKSVPPSKAVTERLSGYAGGVVKASRFGASARHGLGAVHLLAFDPSAEDFVDDPWVRRTMVDLVRQSWDDHAKVALVGGASGFDEHRLSMVRRHLDPNESGRWSVVVAAALLVVYAVIAGPVTFRRAARGKNPLRALLELPLWSLGALFLVVGIGAVSKGGRARARRLEVVECASGASRCGALRLRAFFASSADTLQVGSTEPSALLEVVGSGRGVTRALVMEKGRARLEELRGRPWETVLVREDGFRELGGAVTLRAEGKDFRLTNGLPRPLVAVIALTSAGELVSLGRVAPGASVLGSAGNVITTVPSPPVVAAPATMATAVGLIAPHRLEAYRFTERANSLWPGSGTAWEAMEYVAPDEADWWPERVPVVLTEIEGGTGTTEDSELRVDQDRLLLRVVGESAP